MSNRNPEAGERWVLSEGGRALLRARIGYTKRTVLIVEVLSYGCYRILGGLNIDLAVLDYRYRKAGEEKA